MKTSLEPRISACADVPLRYSFGSLVLWTALCCLLAWLSHRPLWHTDLWDHVNYGRHMLATGELSEHAPEHGASIDFP